MGFNRGKIAKYELRRGATPAGMVVSRHMAAIASICSVLLLAAVIMIHNKAGYTDEAMQASAYSRLQSNSRRPKNTAPTPPPVQPSPLPPPVIGDVLGVGSALIPPAWARLPIYRDPANTASAYAKANPADANAQIIGRIGDVPVATWFGDWDANPKAAVDAYVSAGVAAGATPVAVLYNIPQRDCGNYSAGGVNDTISYINWIQSVAAGIGNRSPVVVLEPDALAGLDCLSLPDQINRYAALSQAVAILKTTTKAYVYIDAGNAAWQPASTTASRLNKVNIAMADGFSLNVANFVTSAKSQAYGDQVSKLVGDKHYLIDTSRNGNGNLSPDAWCNNMSAALGAKPTTTTGNVRNDALLWVKIPWESDGTCNGGPSAGSPYWSFVAQLAWNAGW
jgi:endoglucanase